MIGDRIYRRPSKAAVAGYHSDNALRSDALAKALVGGYHFGQTAGRLLASWNAPQDRGGRTVDAVNGPGVATEVFRCTRYLPEHFDAVRAVVSFALGVQTVPEEDLRARLIVASGGTSSFTDGSQIVDQAEPILEAALMHDDLAVWDVEVEHTVTGLAGQSLGQDFDLTVSLFATKGNLDVRLRGVEIWGVLRG